jgi:hypothetical protein
MAKMCVMKAYQASMAKMAMAMAASAEENESSRRQSANSIMAANAISGVKAKANSAIEMAAVCQLSYLQLIGISWRKRRKEKRRHRGGVRQRQRGGRHEK